MDFDGKIWILHQKTVNINLKVGALRLPIFLWIVFSLASVFISNLLSLYGKDLKLHFSFFLERMIDVVIMVGISVQLITSKTKRSSFKTLADYVSESVGEFPEDSNQSEIIVKYKRRVSRCALAIMIFVTLGILFEIIAPLVTGLRSYHRGTPIQELPVPLGRIPFFVDSLWSFAIFYLISSTALLTCSCMYVCWFTMFFNTSLHLEAKLKLLIMDIQGFEKPERTSASEISLVMKDHNGPQPLMNSNGSADRFLKDIVKRHVQIMEYVKVVECTFRWVNIAYCKCGILITALTIMILVDEWYDHGKIIPDKLNMVLSTFFFLYITNYAGQILLEQSSRLREALYGVNWMDKRASFCRSLYIMLTVTRRPIRLTAGTVFTLGMESYSSIMEAVYSYVNFLIPVRQLK